MLKTIIFAALTVAVLAEEIKFKDRPEVREQIRNQCEKNGAGADKADEIVTVIDTAATCASNVINLDTIKKEIEEAKPNGALDEVFKKYCAKGPQIKACISSFLDGISPCLDSTVRAEIGSIKNGTDQLLDFVCYKDGDRIALFIAEGGPQCFQEQATAIRQCADDIKNSVESIDAAKTLTIQERCNKFKELKTCIVGKLEACSTPTPANMIDSLLEYIRKNSPCKAY